MASAPVLGAAKRSVELDPDAFGARFNGPLIHESVRAEFAARRRGSASTKTRGLVRGGGAKPWRQKGTGRARAGSSRSPVWTGGGTVFGPHPRSYTFKVNRKERRAALRSALSLHADRGSLAILDVDAFLAPSTRAAAALLAGWVEPRPTLVVVITGEREAALSFRNIDRVSVLEPNSVGVADIVGAASLLCSDAALAELAARAAGSTGAGDSREKPVAKAAAAEGVVAAKAAPAAKPPAVKPVAKAPTAAKPAAKAAAEKPVAKAAVEKPAGKAAAPTAKPAAAKGAAKDPSTTAKPAAKKPAKATPPAKPAAKAAVAQKPVAKTAKAPPAKAKAPAQSPAPAKPRATKPKAAS